MIWAYWLKASTMNIPLAKAFKGKFAYMADHAFDHDVHEWHNLNLREFFDIYSTKRHREVVEFIQLRFELFTKRVNKKAMAYLQEKLVMTDKQALVRYFEIQKRCLIEQEKSGYDEAYNTMHISKSQLLEKHSEYL